MQVLRRFGTTRSALFLLLAGAFLVRLAMIFQRPDGGGDDRYAYVLGAFRNARKRATVTS